MVSSLSSGAAEAGTGDGAERKSAAQAGHRIAEGVRVASRVGQEARQRSQRRRWPVLIEWVSWRAVVGRVSREEATCLAQARRPLGRGRGTAQPTPSPSRPHGVYVGEVAADHRR